MTFLATLILGNGTLKPELSAALKAEGLVLIEEGLPGSLHYHHFKAPGKRFHGKVISQRIGLGISRKRFVAYGSSGRVKLIDSEFSNPRLGMLDVELDGGEKIKLRIDYDRGDVPNVSGVVTITAKTPNAARVAEHLRARLDP